MRGVETTIAVGQNGNPTDIGSMPARNVSSREFRLIVVAAARAHVTELVVSLKVRL